MHVHCPRDVPDLAAGPESAPVGTSARHILDIATGSRAYILGMTALHILDVSNPGKPVEAMALPLPAQFLSLNGGNVVVAGDYAYTAVSDSGGSSGGVVIFRITAP